LFTGTLSCAAHTIEVIGIGMIGLCLAGCEHNQGIMQQPLLAKPGKELAKGLIGLQERLLVVIT
jgi:hypothetical protein